MFARFFKQFRDHAHVRKVAHQNRSSHLRRLRLGVETLEDRRLLTAGPFKIVMLPDTQFYSDDNYPQFDWIFGEQTQWVADQINVEEENIVFLTHVGDLVQNGGDTDEWGIADPAMGILDSDVSSLPYGASPGNHDYDVTSGWYPHGNFSEFVNYFGPTRYANYEQRWGANTYGYSAAPEIDGLNHFQIFTGDGQQYLNISLEWQARQESINWAQAVIDAHPDLPVIISTHEYLGTGNPAAHRISAPAGGAERVYHDGQQIFDELVYSNPQVFMVLSGHVTGAGRLTSSNAAGQGVYEMLADYQNSQDGGNGYLRIMEFDPSVTVDSIQVTTYSPSVDASLTDGANQFGLDVDFADRFSFAPTARLYAPVDNDVQDQDHTVNSVKVDSPQAEFQIQLYGHSDGIDDNTVDADVLSIERDSVLMDPSTYSFTYNTTDDRITLRRNDNQLFDFGTYEITVSLTGDKIKDSGDPTAREMPQTVFTVEVFSPGSDEYSSKLVPEHSTWRYLDDGSNQGTAWRESNFVDSSWDLGPAELGYGDNAEGTVVSYGPSATDKYVTTYFRHDFEVPNPTAIEALELKLRRDDAAVIYLNGYEIERSNITGTVDYLTSADVAVGGGGELIADAVTLDAADLSRLVEGTNTLAVEIHQYINPSTQTVTSSDISFDLELAATYTIPTLFDAGSGILSVFGSPGADEISLAADAQDYVTIDTGNGPVRIVPNVAAGDVVEIRVYGYAGDDTIDLSGVDTDFTSLAASGAIRIEAAEGNDTIIGSDDFGVTYVFNGDNLGTDAINPDQDGSNLESGDILQVAAGSVATFANDLTIDSGATYAPQLDVNRDPEPETLIAGRVDVAGTANLDGTLLPQRCRHQDGDDPLDPKDSPPLLSHSEERYVYGGYTVQVINAQTITGTFATAPLPHDLDDHLGHGVFLTDIFSGTDGHSEAVKYDDDIVHLDLFQAAPGDTDGNRKVEGADVLRFLGAGKFDDPDFAEWWEGDFDGNHRFSNDDILLMQAESLFGDGTYWTGADAGADQGGESAPMVGSTVGLILTPQGLMIDTHGAAINGYVIESELGIFTGKRAKNLGMFREDTDGRISGSFDYVLDGKHVLGKVIGNEFAAVDLGTDLTLRYTIEGQTGIYTATIATTASAETLIWLADYDADDESTFSHGIDPAAANLLLATL